MTVRRKVDQQVGRQLTVLRPVGRKPASAVPTFNLILRNRTKELATIPVQAAPVPLAAKPTIVLSRKYKHRLVTHVVELVPHIQSTFYRNRRGGKVVVYPLSFPRTLWFIKMVNGGLAGAHVAVTAEEYAALKEDTPLFILPMPNQTVEANINIPRALCTGSAGYRSDNALDAVGVTEHLLDSVWNHDLGNHCRTWGVKSLAVWATESKKNPEFYKKIRYSPFLQFDTALRPANDQKQETVGTFIKRISGEEER